MCGRRRQRGYGWISHALIISRQGGDEIGNRFGRVRTLQFPSDRELSLRQAALMTDLRRTSEMLSEHRLGVDRGNDEQAVRLGR